MQGFLPHVQVGMGSFNAVDSLTALQCVSDAPWAALRALLCLCDGFQFISGRCERIHSVAELPAGSGGVLGSKVGEAGLAV